MLIFTEMGHKHFVDIEQMALKVVYTSFPHYLYCKCVSFLFQRRFFLFNYCLILRLNKSTMLLFQSYTAKWNLVKKKKKYIVIKYKAFSIFIKSKSFRRTFTAAECIYLYTDRMQISVPTDESLLQRLTGERIWCTMSWTVE